MQTAFHSRRLYKDSFTYNVFGIMLYFIVDQGVWIGSAVGGFENHTARMGLGSGNKRRFETMPRRLEGMSSWPRTFTTLHYAQRVNSMAGGSVDNVPPSYSMERHYKNPTPGGRYARIHE